MLSSLSEFSSASSAPPAVIWYQVTKHTAALAGPRLQRIIFELSSDAVWRAKFLEKKSADDSSGDNSAIASSQSCPGVLKSIQEIDKTGPTIPAKSASLAGRAFIPPSNMHVVTYEIERPVLLGGSDSIYPDTFSDTSGSTLKPLWDRINELLSPCWKK